MASKLSVPTCLRVPSSHRSHCQVVSITKLGLTPVSDRPVIASAPPVVSLWRPTEDIAPPQEDPVNAS